MIHIFVGVPAQGQSPHAVRKGPGLVLDVALVSTVHLYEDIAPCDSTYRPDHSVAQNTPECFLPSMRVPYTPSSLSLLPFRSAIYPAHLITYRMSSWPLADIKAQTFKRLPKQATNEHVWYK